ncbi:MAG: glyoxalase [Methylophaga sp.]|nr:MAG: glyoxalase [Methylophaga sp.]
MSQHEKIDYLEFPATNIEKTKVFFSTVFDWSFADCGPDYTTFSNAGVLGGFYKSDLISSTKNGSALTVFYSKNLTDTQSKIENAGGKILQAVFSFPGGCRFHFSDPNGNEYAVWSETNS